MNTERKSDGYALDWDSVIGNPPTSRGGQAVKQPLDIPDLSLAAKAYGLHLAVDMIVSRVGDLLSGEAISSAERRRLTQARGALRAAQTHLLAMLDPPCLPANDQQLCDETQDHNHEERRDLT